jgi:hypothetical protein
LRSRGLVLVERREDPDGELGRAAELEQLEQAMEVVVAVAGDPRRQQHREAGLLQLPSPPADRAHVRLVSLRARLLTSSAG